MAHSGPPEHRQRWNGVLTGRQSIADASRDGRSSIVAGAAIPELAGAVAMAGVWRAHRCCREMYGDMAAAI